MVSRTPLLFVMDDFLSEEEMRQIKTHLSNPWRGRCRRRVDKRVKNVSFTVITPEHLSPVEESVLRRAHEEVRIPMEHGEVVQVARYTPGNFYTLHPDSIDSHPYAGNLMRIVTVLIYLSDVEEGGKLFSPANQRNQVLEQDGLESYELHQWCRDENVLKIDQRLGAPSFGTTTIRTSPGTTTRSTARVLSAKVSNGSCSAGSAGRLPSERSRIPCKRRSIGDMTSSGVSVQWGIQCRIQMSATGTSACGRRLRTWRHACRTQITYHCQSRLQMSPEFFGASMRRRIFIPMRAQRRAVIMPCFA